MKNILLILATILISISGCKPDLKIEQAENKDSVQLVFQENDYLIPKDLDLTIKPNRFGRAAIVDISKKVARLNYVVDYDLYVALGSNDAACSTYVLNNHNLAMAAYKPANMFTKIARIEILKVPSAYTPITNIYLMLNAFNNAYYLLPNVDASILLFNKPLGGLAFIGGVNSTSGRSVVCGVYIQNTFYNSFIIAHELGHYFGSPHTHDCWRMPNGTTARLDSCFSGCNQTSTKFTLNGSVMSYCYNRGTIKMPLEFHPRCIDTMQKTLAKNSSIPVEGSQEPPTPNPVVQLAPTSTLTMGANFNTTALPALAFDKVLTDASRWLTCDTATVVSTFSNKFITDLVLHSGFNNGSFNNFIQVWANGVMVFQTTSNNLKVRTIPLNAPIDRLVVKTFGPTAGSCPRVSRMIELSIFGRNR